ncbi:MAG: MBOAT family O-acyltransferase [Bacteroidota bacterium]|nr:MBOAT family O-acyltransferase [Bacteroidota bacterium]
MRPYKTFLVFLVLMVLLYGPAFFISGPLKIAPGFSIRLPEIRSDYLRRDLNVEDTVATGMPVDTIKTQSIVDTADFAAKTEASHLFDFSGSQMLSGTLRELIKSDTGQLRIMYYGDSQVEGDRITYHLREELRKSLPGTGPGLLSITPLVPYTRTSHVTSSGNWKKYDYLSYREGLIKHRRLGPLMSISRFTEPDVKSNTNSSAWFSVEPSRYADSLAAIYNNLRFFYGRLETELLVKVYTEKGLIKMDTLQASGIEQEYSVKLDSAAYLKVDFKGKNSPDFYGFSVESSKGAVVDNIPGRGSAGLEYTMIPRDNLDRLYGMISPDVIVLHYGLNVVLNISTSYEYYENGIYSQLERLKDLCPGTVIILMGLTDMAHKVDGDIVSFANIPLIRDAQRRAVQRAGVLFWDSWQAMGGKNSIIEWNRHVPALAANDYTHLTYAGSAELADLLLKDIYKLQAAGLKAAFKPEEDTLVASKDSMAIEVWQKRDFKFDSSRLLRALESYDPERPLLFTGSSFWIFLFVTMLFYSLIFKKPLLRNTYLFLFSLFFYYKSGGVFFFLLIISTITDYISGLVIYGARRKAVKRLFVLLSLMVNLGMLSYFKYTGFFTGVVNNIFNTDLPVIDWFAAISNFYFGTGFNIDIIMLPVGISFFTFQTISYTMDVYRGKTKPVRNILDFGFYVSFFPQLVAGPIVRASEFVPQLYAPFRLSRREWGHALFLIVGGLIKKIIISDLISVNFVDRVFDTPLLYSGLENLIAVYGYGLQIYCDFSGYTDIAIGVALMLGYRLPVNFNSPYKAHNITDFWHRWHISLSRWLKDYLYISMGGNRRGRFRTHVNLMITMLLGGLWHGAAWRFVIWGGLHGLGLVINKLWMKIFPRRGEPGRFKRFISVFITFNFVSFCWIFFRAVDMEHVYLMLRQMFTAFSPGDLLTVFTTYSQVIIIIVCGYILHFLPVKIKESYRGLFIRLPLVIKIILVYLLAMVLFNVQSADIQPFIYFRF